MLELVVTKPKLYLIKLKIYVSIIAYILLAILRLNSRVKYPISASPIAEIQPTISVNERNRIWDINTSNQFARKNQIFGFKDKYVKPDLLKDQTEPRPVKKNRWAKIVILVYLQPVLNSEWNEIDEIVTERSSLTPFGYEYEFRIRKASKS
jgi:hypothetical protein